LYAARRAGCRVLAFEPAAANFHVLARNIMLNELADRISAYCVALAGKTRLGVLNLDSTAMGAALSHFGIAGDRSRYMGANISAQSTLGFTIDRFIELFDPPFPTHIKIDVDGLELAIIEGATGTLRDPRLRAVMLELSLSDSGERNAGMDLMEGAGLRYVAHGAAQSSNNESAANHLFVR
ncbi:MAG: FkbM family methyltransferase, partial [Methylocystis sp.]